jgi:trimethylamine--corrinoid protein Co-methyltransferase
MIPQLQVLSEPERTQLHERTLYLLATTGLRVDTDRGRQILGEAGAEVDELTRVVRFPRALVESALQSAQRQFTLGGRRPGWVFPMNAEECTLQADGGAMFVYDSQTKERRPATFDDWLKATRLIDALDEVGVYWAMVQPTFAERSPGDFVAYWRGVLRHFSKHVQECPATPEHSRWMLEVLHTVFGGREAVRRLHPVSFLLCPSSPLVIEGAYTDAYLETLGWDLPVAAMPMPLMGSTAPGSLISTLLLANCEVLAILCLVQAAAPGTPFIYAPAPSVMDPTLGRYDGGEPELTLLGAAVTEMARFYGLPSQTPTGGTSHHVPGIQAGYERALNWVFPALSWPDLLLGPGLLGGAMTLSLEQLMIDVEIFRRCRRLGDGIDSSTDCWLEDVIAAVGPGGNFLAQRSTRDGLRRGEWYISSVGVHGTYERWEAGGKQDLLAEMRESIAAIQAKHQALPLDEAIERELETIEQRARQAG